MKLPKPPRANHVSFGHLQTQVKAWKVRNGITFQTQSANQPKKGNKR